MKLKKQSVLILIQQLQQLQDDIWQLKRLVATFYAHNAKAYLAENMVEVMKEAREVTNQMVPGTPCRSRGGVPARTIGFDGAFCIYYTGPERAFACDLVAGPLASYDIDLSSLPSMEAVLAATAALARLTR